jgi:class 3 adenylate cyclase
MYGKSANLNNSNSASTADNSNDKIKSIKYTGNSSSLTWKDKLHSFIQTKFFKIYSCIITVISLLLDDIQIISSNESADLPFDIIHIVLSLLIFIEIIIFFIADETYGFSLFFFIDIIFLVSLLFGIMKIYDKLIYYESGSRLLTNMDRIALIKLVTALKVLRIIRIGKIVTMFNHSFFTKSYDDDNETEDLKEEGGNISSTFIDFSSYKIFVFYASLVIGVILFNPELFMTNKIYDNEYSIQLFSEQNFLKNNIYSALLLFDSYIDFLKNSKNVLIFAKFYGIIFINDTFNQKLRKSERLIYYKEYADYINNTIEDKDNTNELDKSLIDYIKSEYFNDSDIDANQLNNIIKEITFDANNTNFLLFTETNNKNILIINSSNYGIYQEKLDRLRSLNLIPQETSIQNKCISIYDNTYTIKKYCIFNIVRTIFSISIFLFIYLLFLFNINNTVLSPIETMIKKIKKMSKNPTLISEMSSNENNQKKKSHCLNILEDSQGNYKMNEFQIIENKISKICSLVSFGFGEAGTQIISQVLKEGLNVDINPIIPGKKVMGIYGFCDIRNFTDTTEILKEKVMVFVNQVAEIVHQITADYCGGANKNIGDAFLLVWKFENQFIKEVTNKQGKIELKLKKINRVRQICDLALICFIRILIEINKSFKLAVYRQHKELNARMKNYKTRLGFGLHLGQSIEGAIGSMFKIDASYLSTNVNMANNLEENTKTFKKELIMSGDFYDYLSDDAKRYLRLLDIFKTKNGEITRLYSIDLDLENIPIEKQKDSMFKEDNIEKKMEILQQKRKMAKILYDDIVLRHKSDIWNDFVNDEDDFKLVREKFPDNFVDVYNNGMEYFRNGNWAEAKNCLVSAQELLGEEDPACKRNLEYMEKSNFTSPPNWKGYREEE